MINCWQLNNKQIISKLIPIQIILRTAFLTSVQIKKETASSIWKTSWRWIRNKFKNWIATSKIRHFWPWPTTKSITLLFKNNLLTTNRLWRRRFALESTIQLDRSMKLMRKYSFQIARRAKIKRDSSRRRRTWSTRAKRARSQKDFLKWNVTSRMTMVTPWKMTKPNKLNKQAKLLKKEIQAWKSAINRQDYETFGLTALIKR